MSSSGKASKGKTKEVRVDRRDSSSGSVLFFLLGLILSLILSFLLISSYNAEVKERTFEVSGSSMESTYYTGDKLVFPEGSKGSLPERGSMAVFHKDYRKLADSVGSQELEPDRVLIKRAVALPGDTVKLEIPDKNDRARQETLLTVTYKDENLGGKENTFFTVLPYQCYPLYLNNSSGELTGSLEVTLPENKYLFLGDNRSGSLDAFSEFCRSLSGDLEGLTEKLRETYTVDASSIMFSAKQEDIEIKKPGIFWKINNRAEEFLGGLLG